MQRKTAAGSLARTRADSHAASPEPDIDALAAELHRAHALTLVRMANLLAHGCAEPDQVSAALPAACAGTLDHP